MPLTPLSFLARTAAIHPERTAILHHELKRSWAETYRRCRRLASALVGRGIRPGDTVSVMAPNIPAMIELHFGVGMAGAVLNTLNVRLDPDTIAFSLDHAEARLPITDPEFSGTVARALGKLDRKLPVIDIDDPFYREGERLCETSYEALLGKATRNSRGPCRPTNGGRSRSTTPRAPPATRRAWSIATAAPI